MKKLFEIFRLPRAEGDVGIEIEVEGARFPEQVPPQWRSDVDGSLRGESREFILAKPIPFKQVKKALTDLEECLKAAKTKLTFSFRTSVHVHINVQDLNMIQYQNFLYTYLLLEEPLMTYCGRERKGNRFCLRLQDAEGMLESFLPIFRDHEVGLKNVPNNQVRYSAVNIEATKKYGSLEFRGMRGNLDVETLDTWVSALHQLRDYAVKMESPVDIYDAYSKLDPTDFIREVLGDKLAAKFYYPKMVKDIQRSFSLSIDLPFVWAKEPPAPPKVNRAIHKAAGMEYVELAPGRVHFILSEDLLEQYEQDPVGAFAVMKARMDAANLGIYNMIHPKDL